MKKIQIPNNNKSKKRYDGLKGKLIHLEPRVFNLLNSTAKRKKMTLKVYLETLCLIHATNIVEETLQKSKK